VWVECRVIALCGWSAELSHCVGGVQRYLIVWVECRFNTLCSWSAELPHYVGGVQS